MEPIADHLTDNWQTLLQNSYYEALYFRHFGSISGQGIDVTALLVCGCVTNLNN